MRVAIDVDDVVLELMDSWLEVYNEKTGTAFSKDQMLNWDLTKNGLDTTAYDILSQHAEKIYSRVYPIEGAQQAVRLIHNSGYEVVYITAAVAKTLDAKVDALERFGFLRKGRTIDDRLIVTGRKNLIDADILIDDKPENIIRWPYPRKGILFTQPWNDRVTLLPERAVRCSGWTEVLEHLGLIRGVYVSV